MFQSIALQREAMDDSPAFTDAGESFAPATVGEALAPIRFVLNPIGSIIERMPLDTNTMLNANRTVDPMDTTPLTSAIPASSALESSPTISFDWKKYLPWIIALVVILVVLYATRSKRS